MDGRPVYLRGKPQPTLSNVHEGELVHRVGHGAGRIDVPVCTHSELIAGHLTPGFIVTLKASAQGFTLADLVRGRAVRACGHCERETEVNVVTLADLVRGRAVRACGHCERETEVNVDAWSSSHPMHPNCNANRYHQKQRQRHRKINRIRIHLSTSLLVAGTKLT